MTEDRVNSTKSSTTGSTGQPAGEGTTMYAETYEHRDYGMREGDIVEFSLRGERRTAEVMLITEDEAIGPTVLLELFDGDRPAWARLGALEDVAVYRPDLAGELIAA